MRKKFIAGNWKMNTRSIDGELLAAAVVKGLGGETGVTVAVCPPFPFLPASLRRSRGRRSRSGRRTAIPRRRRVHRRSQPRHARRCRLLLCHRRPQRRRQNFGETDAFINEKVHAALKAKLKVILCIGETLDERKANRTEAVLDTQLTGSLAKITAEQLANIAIAYEPVWAIGTGVNATPQQAQDAHAFVRKHVGQLCGESAAQAVIIQYGGSVKPDNAKTLLGQPDVDGALVGGASLKAEDFLAIVRAGI